MGMEEERGSSGLESEMEWYFLSKLVSGAYEIQ